jgi:hypothetical protein
LKALDILIVALVLAPSALSLLLLRDLASFVWVAAGLVAIDALAILLLSRKVEKYFPTLAAANGVICALAVGISSSPGLLAPVFFVVSGMAASVLGLRRTGLARLMKGTLPSGPDEEARFVNALGGLLLGVLGFLGLVLVVSLMVALLALNLDLGGVSIGLVAVLLLACLVSAGTLVLSIRPRN